MDERKHIECVVFDLDDTLYLESEFVRSGFAAVSDHLLQRFGWEGVFDELWSIFQSGARGNVFNLLLKQKGIGAEEAELVRESVEVYRGHIPHLHPCPDVLSTLRELKARGTALGLISDGIPEVQRRKFDALGIGEFFDKVIFTGELGEDKSKPSPEAFELIEAELKVPGSKCLYVGDNPAKDFVAPRTLGWLCVWIRREQGLYVEEPFADDGEPDVSISSLMELPGLLA